jgi:hypothetical protein
MPKPPAIHLPPKFKPSDATSAVGKAKLVYYNALSEKQRQKLESEADKTPGLGMVLRGKKQLEGEVEKKKKFLLKHAFGTELRIAGGLARKIRMPRFADKLERAAKTGPAAVKKWLLHEPKMQPKFMKGRHILPEKVRDRAADIVANEPALGAVWAVPTGPAGPLGYLAARGAAGRAAGVRNAHLPHESVPIPKVVRKLLSKKPAAPAALPTGTKVGSVLDRFVSREQRKATGNADRHFKAESPDWDAFLKNSKRKSFVKAVQGDSRADSKLMRHVDRMNRLQTGKTLETVKGRTGTYEIRRLRGGGLGCTCPDWRYRQSVSDDPECRHIRAYKFDKKHTTKQADSVRGLKSRLEPGDIILMTPQEGKTRFDAAFGAVSRTLQGPYTHASMYVGNGELVEARIGQGVDKLSVNKALRGKGFAVVRPMAERKTREQAATVARESLSSKQYSGQDLIAAGTTAMLPRVGNKVVKKILGKGSPERKRAFQCGGLVAGSYAAVGEDLHPDVHWRFLAPTLFLSSPHVQVIGRAGAGKSEGKPAVGSYRRSIKKVLDDAATGLSIAQTHHALDRLGVDWEGAKFMKFCKLLVGKSHLDDMTSAERREVVAAVRKQEAGQS